MEVSRKFEEKFVILFLRYFLWKYQENLKRGIS